MSWLRSLVALVAAAIPLQGASEGAWKGCAVTHVVDGDTIDVACGSARTRVRLLRIDTPERGDPGYKQAADALATLLGNGRVELEFEKPGLAVRDEFDRLLAYVHAGGRNVNVEMVRLGWSPFWTKYGAGRLASEFERAEEEARRAARGVGDSGTRRHFASDGSKAESCRSRDECCRVCTRGVPCGDSCISASRSCHKGTGCACAASDLCND